MNVLADLIARAGRQYSGRDAVIGARRTMTFAEVDDESSRLARWLSATLGLGKGERVAILLGNCPEFVVADFALVKAGLIRVPVNPRYARAEVEFILAHSGAAVLVTDAERAGTLAGINEAAPALKRVLVADAGEASVPPGTIGWGEAQRGAAPGDFFVDTDDADGYMIGYTSGTTGRPKGALTTVGARWANIFNCYANEMFVTTADTMLHVASLAHGSGTKVLPLFARGAKNVMLAKFSPAEFFRLVEAHRVTISWMVPTLVAMLTDSPERQLFDVSSLQTVIYGGAPMPEPVLERALAAFGPIFVQIYGLTEAPHPDLVLGKLEHLINPATGGRRAAGATGRAAVGVQLRLVDTAGRDVPIGEPGEIVVAGAHVMSGYWNDAAATAETLIGGWCHTGDIARVDTEGFFRIVDRKKEMIISGGYNIYPREVEDVLYRHADVEECAVVGMPDELWGETVHAFIVPVPGHTVAGDDMAAFCARELAGYKKPRSVTTLSELPKTANGKIDKKALRSHLLDARRGQTKAIA
ncbi:MAG: AMP-binding protein [Caldimonas sp.]